jgi:MFS family permease
MSEIPVFGRNAPYMVSFALFVILCVPLALVENFAGLLVLRFLVGFMGSPCLATGGATMQDMVCMIKVVTRKFPLTLCLVLLGQATICLSRVGVCYFQWSSAGSDVIWVCGFGRKVSFYRLSLYAVAKSCKLAMVSLGSSMDIWTCIHPYVSHAA